MPPSISPLAFTFTFWRDSRSFMQITTSLIATFEVIESTSVALSIEETDIAGEYPYIFTIITSQELGKNPKIVL